MLPSLKEVYEANAPHILGRHRVSESNGIYNFPADNTVSLQDFVDHLQYIFTNSKWSFKLNIAFGVILREVGQEEEGRFRYFIPHTNETVFDIPVRVSTQADLEKVRQRLEDMDVLEYMRRQRPNTKWQPFVITNLVFYTYNTNFVLGGTDENPLPSYITNNHQIVALVYNKYKKTYFHDGLCAFRALAYHRTKKTDVERLTHENAHLWQVYCREHKITRSEDGLDLDNIYYFEQCFKISVNIFQLSASGTCSCEYLSTAKYADKMNLNLFDGHLSYITKLSSYSKKFECRICGYCFGRVDNCKRHEATCDQQTRFTYPGGFYENPKSLWQELESYGFEEKGLRHFPWFAVFDFEAMLLKQDTAGASNLMWTQRHDPVSVSVCSNVDGYKTEKCFVNVDSQALLSDMIDYLETISDRVYDKARATWDAAFKHLDNMIQRWKPPEGDEENDDEAMETDHCEPASAAFHRRVKKPNVYREFMKNLVASDRFDVEYNEWTEEEEEEEEVEEEVPTQKDATASVAMHGQLVALRTKLEGYCRQCPVLGFNSAR